MSFTTPLEVARFAREHLPFYRELYQDLPAHFTWPEVPAIDKENYWQKRVARPSDFRSREGVGGYVWRTSGSTSQARFLEISTQDFAEEITLTSHGLAAGGWRPGERVANLFVAGDLRSSFILTTFCLQRLGVLEIPILLGTPIARTLDLLRDFAVETVIGIPSTFQLLAEELFRRGEVLEVPRLLYAGEHLYADGRAVIEAAFRPRHLGPLIYGGVDVGPVAVPVGRSDQHRQESVYRAIPGFAVIEIVDDQRRPIRDAGEEGDVLVTNLSRRLSPVVRFPIGDRAVWRVGPHDGAFELRERGATSLRVGVSTVEHGVVATALEDLPGMGRSVQLVARRQAGRDLLLCRCLYQGDPTSAAALAVASTARERLVREYPFFGERFDGAFVTELVVEPCRVDGFEYRSGKRPAVVDERRPS